MPASRSRTRRRKQLCRDRKQTALWWIGCWTVRVHLLREGVWYARSRVKAQEGAERSFRVKQRRSCRGQRKGKKRARGRQPREPPVPAQDNKVRCGRSFNRRLRLIDYWYDRVHELGEHMKRSRWLQGLPRLPDVVTPRAGPWEPLPTQTLEYRKWKARWLSLAKRIPKDEEVRFCSRIGPTFSYYLEQQHRVSFHFDRTAAAELQGLRRDLNERNPPHLSFATRRERDLPNVTCRCRTCFRFRECPSGHGMGAGVLQCPFCGYRRHGGRVPPRSSRRGARRR